LDLDKQIVALHKHAIYDSCHKAMDYKQLLEITQQNVYVNITVERDIVIRPMNTHSHSQIKKR